MSERAAMEAMASTLTLFTSRSENLPNSIFPRPPAADCNAAFRPEPALAVAVTITGTLVPGAALSIMLSRSLGTFFFDAAWACGRKFSVGGITAADENTRRATIRSLRNPTIFFIFLPSLLRPCRRRVSAFLYLRSLDRPSHDRVPGVTLSINVPYAIQRPRRQLSRLPARALTGSLRLTNSRYLAVSFRRGARGGAFVW